MRCRHTVPDWHRYVAAGEVTRPVFAACRLLIKEGELASDARGIACTFWGHQHECPFYDAPASRPCKRPNPTGAVAGDAPIRPEQVWPVRQPGATDGHRLLLMLLGWFSILLLGWAMALAVVELFGQSGRSGYLVVTLVAGSVSSITHFLLLLRLWIRR